MNDILEKMRSLLDLGRSITQSTEVELAKRPSPNKWSKKEILGHLIDSGINNLQRFTEIQFEEKPYKIRSYKQEGLVNANEYQAADISELLNFWLAINKRIENIISKQTDQTLDYHIELKDGSITDFRFLFTDYVLHMEHHMKQLMT